MEEIVELEKFVYADFEKRLKDGIIVGEISKIECEYLQEFAKYLDPKVVTEVTDIPGGKVNLKLMKGE